VIPLGVGLFLAAIVALVAALVAALAMHLWCTRRRRPQVRFTTQTALLDRRTSTILAAVDDLPLGEAYAVLRSINALIDAAATLAALWPDRAEVSAGAAIARVAAQGHAPDRPRLVPR
jgi:hypothetical protein